MTSFEEVLGAYRANQMDLAQLREELGSLLSTDSSVSDQVLEMLDEEHKGGYLSSESHQLLITDIRRSITEDAPTVLDMSLAALPDAPASDAVGERGAEKKKGRSSTRKKPQRRRRKKPVAKKTRKELRGGDTLNERFVLEATLKRGGMGIVFKALDKRRLEVDARRVYVAIKALNLELSLHPDALRALQHEAFQAQSLSHPNIVNVFDFDRDGDIAFITMELLEGETLASLMKRIKPEVLPRDKTMALIADMAAGLAYAHERGILHADFKPANVYVTKDGRAKVLDFGVARALDAGRDAENGSPEFDPGTLGGKTPAYATKETLEGRDPDPRDDVYALACVAYQLLSGRHPYGDLSAKQAQEKAVTLSRVKGLKRRQWRGLAGGLALERGHRTPTVTQLLDELGAVPQAGYRSPARQPEVWGASLVLAALFFAGGNAAYREGYSNAAIPLEPPATEEAAIEGLADQVEHGFTAGMGIAAPDAGQGQIAEPAAPHMDAADRTSPAGEVESAAIQSDSEDPVLSEAASELEISSVGFALGASSVREGAGVAEASILRGGPTDGGISIQWRTEDATASAGEDYGSFEWTALNLEPGVDTYAIYIPIVSDTREEGDEEFALMLKNPSKGTLLGSASMTITIVDDDAIDDDALADDATEEKETSSQAAADGAEQASGTMESAAAEDDLAEEAEEKTGDGEVADSTPMPALLGGDPESSPPVGEPPSVEDASIDDALSGDNS